SGAESEDRYVRIDGRGRRTNRGCEGAGAYLAPDREAEDVRGTCLDGLVEVRADLLLLRSAVPDVSRHADDEGREGRHAWVHDDPPPQGALAPEQRQSEAPAEDDLRLGRGGGAEG